MKRSVTTVMGVALIAIALTLAFSPTYVPVSIVLAVAGLGLFFYGQTRRRHHKRRRRRP